MAPVGTSESHIDALHSDSLADVVLVIDIGEGRIVFWRETS